MHDYIHTCRKEHAKLLEALTQVTAVGIFSRAGQMKLQELKREVESHLINEDLHLYPVLRKAGEADANLRRELFLFAGASGPHFFKQFCDCADKILPFNFSRFGDSEF